MKLKVLHQLFQLATFTGLLVAAAGSVYAEEIPSYQKALDEYNKKSTKAGKSPFSEQDMQVMKNSAMSLAKKMPAPGLKVGEKAPDFKLKSAEGKKVRLSKELKKGPVILVFYRGAWCPFCNLHLHTLNKALPEFKKYQAQLIAVTPQKPDKSAEQLKKAGYPFQVLSDLDSQVMKNYKLYYELDAELVKVYKKHGLDVEQFNGVGRNVLPVPGTFVIDRNGIIRAVHAETDYKKRMEPADIIAVLKKIDKETVDQSSQDEVNRISLKGSSDLGNWY